jgi:thioredoxin 1
MDTFSTDVLEAKGLVVVDFYAEWCGPCRVMGPIIESLANENPTVKFVKVNVDTSPDLAEQYNISSIPTLLIFRDGRTEKQFVGVVSKTQLKEAIR